jgi:hypothetical protein
MGNNASTRMLSPYWTSRSHKAFNGDNIATVPVTAQKDCGKACLSTPACAGFLVSENNDCWLYGQPTKGETIMNDKQDYSPRYTSYQMNTKSNVDWIGPEHMDYPNNDITITGVSNVSECANICSTTPACKGFVVDDNASWCWIKGNFGTPNPSGNRNAFLKNENIVPSTPNPNWTGPEQQIDYSGNDISSMATSKISDCSTACINNPLCKGFVTTDMGDYCWLKSNMATPAPNVNRNSYKMKSNYRTVENSNLGDCENLCENDDTCKAFSFDTRKNTCTLSTDKLSPVGLNTNNIVGNKKIHMALDGTYNIYQNNACLNTSLFGNNPTVTGSMGIILDSNGVPVIPKSPVCESGINNNFIFGKNYEIMTMQKDSGSSDSSATSSSNTYFNDYTTTVDTDTSWDLTDAYCLQKNPNGTISPSTCTYVDNQKWTYDESLQNIRSWDGNCLNVNTSKNKVLVEVKPCSNDVNQRFVLNPVSEKSQQDYNVISTTNTVADVVADGGIGTIDSSTTTTNTRDGWFSDSTSQSTSVNDKTELFTTTNTNINNYLSSDRNKQDYLYKLPYSSPYLMNINDELENYQGVESGTTSLSMYLIYLTVLIFLLVILMRKIKY